MGIVDSSGCSPPGSGAGGRPARLLLGRSFCGRAADGLPRLLIRGPRGAGRRLLRSQPSRPAVRPQPGAARPAPRAVPPALRSAVLPAPWPSSPPPPAGQALPSAPLAVQPEGQALPSAPLAVQPEGPGTSTCASRLFHLRLGRRLLLDRLLLSGPWLARPAAPARAFGRLFLPARPGLQVLRPPGDRCHEPARCFKPCHRSTQQQGERE